MIKNSTPHVPHLLCREIQAPLMAALIKGYSDSIGKDHAIAIAKKVIYNDAIESGKKLAEKFSGNSLKELLRVVEEIWSGDGTMKIENLNLNDTSLSFDVTYCSYAETYERQGIKEFGYLLSCCRDFAFMDGFNPEFELIRTKTIMDGDGVCNFRYKAK